MSPLDLGLHGKTALITGAASGIGAAIAVALAKQGVAVCLADRHSSEETLQAIRRQNGTGYSVNVDLRFEDQVRSMVSQAVEHLASLDLFINVAGSLATESVTRMTLTAWNDILATNVTACAIACRDVARHMIVQGRGGAILIVGSTVMYNPAYAQAAYRVSKTGLKAYMETLAIELAPFAIRVNMLTPGPFPTPLVAHLSDEQRWSAAREVPLGQREGRLPELCPLALALLSDTFSSYVTGADVPVDGGLHLRPLYLGSPEEVKRLNL